MSQRDEIAEMLFDNAITVSMLTARRITDRLLAAGLIAPPGLTADKLREAAAFIHDEWGGTNPDNDAHALMRDLRDAATFLDAQETP